jgi:chromosome segregation ATPase
MVSNKVKNRDQITKKIKETIQQKIKTEQEHLKSTAEKQKLERERIAADRTLIAAAQDTANKREASSRDPENIETKNLLIVAEQIEDLARQVTQRYTGKLATLNKLIATQATSIESLITEIPELNVRTEQLTTEHQQLITQRAKAAEEKDINLAKMKATQSKILRIEKQVQLLKKTAQDQEKILIAAQKELTNTMDKRSKFAERLKKWKTAAVNTRLIETRLELASIDKDDPAVASKIVELQRKCDDLALKYQAAKK